MYAGASGSCSGVFLRATLGRRSQTNVRTLSANSIPILHSRRRLSTALLSRPTTTTSRRRVIGSSVPGAPSEACAIGTGRTQSFLPHQVTSCLPTKPSRAFASGTKHLFKSSQQLHLPPKTSSGIMSLQKETLQPGDGRTFPKQGDTVIMEYTGWLFDESADRNRGKQFDSSVGRGDFKTPIGVGRVIQGWDQGVPQMSLGERAVLTIPGHMAYGTRGFPGLIPPNATLIFEVQLKNIQ